MQLVMFDLPPIEAKPSPRNAIDRIKNRTGLKQREVADALGLSVNHVSRVRRGKLGSPHYLHVIAEFLETIEPERWPARWQGGELP